MDRLPITRLGYRLLRRFPNQLQAQILPIELYSIDHVETLNPHDPLLLEIAH